MLKYIKNNRLKTTVLAIIPNLRDLKRTLLSYGCDDFLCIPYCCEDLILRCKNLIKCIPTKYEIVYESDFLRYESKFDRIMYENTQIPLTPREILIVTLLIKRSFVSKEDIERYLRSKIGVSYSEIYIRLIIHRIRKKIRLSTGRDLIRNKYGQGYYIL